MLSIRIDSKSLTPHSRPATDEVVWTQVFSPYLRYLGPAWLRRFLLELVPIPGVQRLKTISDIVSKRMEEIYFAKKAAIESGDSDLLHAMGEGKDIISVLRESTFMLYVIFKTAAFSRQLRQYGRT